MENLTVNMSEALESLVNYAVSERKEKTINETQERDIRITYDLLMEGMVRLIADKYGLTRKKVEAIIFPEEDPDELGEEISALKNEAMYEAGTVMVLKISAGMNSKMAADAQEEADRLIEAARHDTEVQKEADEAVAKASRLATESLGADYIRDYETDRLIRATYALLNSLDPKESHEKRMESIAKSFQLSLPELMDAFPAPESLDESSRDRSAIFRIADTKAAECEAEVRKETQEKDIRTAFEIFSESALSPGSEEVIRMIAGRFSLTIDEVRQAIAS